MVLTDTLMTVFATTGADTLLNALKDIENAMSKLNRTQLKFQSGTAAFNTSVQTSSQALNGFTLSLANQISTGIAGFLTLETVGRGAVRLFHAVTEEVRGAVQAYADFGREVMNIRDLTGSSAGESAQAVLMARAAGMSDMQQIREVLRLSRADFSGSGRAALGRLGVVANPNEEGLSLFNKIADAYQRSNLSPLLKTKMMEDIFGGRSVANLMPMMRMTQAQRHEVEALANEYDTRALPAVQQFQFASAMLGETLMVKIAFPLAQTFIPVIESVITILSGVAGAFSWLNKELNGALLPMLAFAALGASLATIWIAVGRITTAFKALLPILKANAAVQAFITALSPGGAGRVIGAAALTGAITGGVIGLGVYGLSRMGGSEEGGSTTPQSKFSAAVDKFSGVVDTMHDDFGRSAGKGFPGALSAFSLGQFARQNAMGAIG